MSCSSRRSRAFELLLREANNLLRQDDAKKSLSPRRRPRKVRKSLAQPRRYKRPATVVPGSTNQAPEPPSSPGPFNSTGAVPSTVEKDAAAILARPPSQVGHFNAEADSSEQVTVDQEGNDRIGIPEGNQEGQCPLSNKNPPPPIAGGSEEITASSASLNEATRAPTRPLSPFADVTEEAQLTPGNPAPAHTCTARSGEPLPILEGKEPLNGVPSSPLPRASRVLGQLTAEEFPALSPTGAPSATELCAPSVPINTGRRSQRAEKPAASDPRPRPPRHTSPGTQLETVLYRPAVRRETFRTATQEAISSCLAPLEGVSRVRVNFGRNVVAVDVTAGTPLDPLLAVADICGIAVRAKQASTNTCSGVIYNVDPALDEDSIRANIASRLPVLQCSRSGRHVIVRFAGNKAPPDVELFKQRRPVRARRPRPTQCELCGRYGHTDVTCTSERRCVRCGGPHSLGECTAKKARCFYCGAAHPATEPRCPRWQEERRLLEVRAESSLPISRREALAIARGQNTGDPATPGSTTMSRAHPLVCENFSYAAAAGLPSAKNSQTATDKRNSVIAVLSAALTAAMDFLPLGCPVRPLCAAALATHLALTNDGE